MSDALIVKTSKNVMAWGVEGVGHVQGGDMKDIDPEAYYPEMQFRLKLTIKYCNLTDILVLAKSRLRGPRRGSVAKLLQNAFATLRLCIICLRGCILCHPPCNSSRR